MKKFILLFLVLSASVQSENSKILCELNGDFSVTYKDIKKTYLAEGIELFKNLARQTQQSLFLLRRAKTNFAEEDWQKSSMYVVQYWEIDSEKEIFNSLMHTLEPSPSWINEDASWSVKNSKTGFSVTHSMVLDEEHPLFPEYKVQFYEITNTFNWFTGKGQIFGDIWLKKKDGTRGRNPKIEIFANGNCQSQKKKF
ncbi:MAG: hypothetical protein CMD80_03830 [Gammaproteobacteria bacterium]|nr:hypothetical protein [Gammaproteobacteria bacterium]